MGNCYGWMDDLRFYVLFNNISVISGRWLDDNERLCARDLRYETEHFSDTGITYVSGTEKKSIRAKYFSGTDTKYS